MTSAPSPARRLAAAVAALLIATGVRAVEPQPPRQRDGAAAAGEPHAPPAPLDVGDRVIRKAVVESRDPADDVRPTARAAFGSAPPAGGRRVDRAFDDAAVPTCLTPEAFEHDQPVVGAFGLGGFLALPWWARAIIVGRCRY